MSGTTLFWLSPILPLIVFALAAIGLARYGRLVAGLAIAAMTGSFIISTLSIVDVVQGKRAFVSLPWLTVGGRALSLALWLDPLAALMAMLVSVVGLMIFVYAASYMAADPRLGRFFAEFSLFTGSMLTLVLAADLITLFIAWELVGLCSYLLIGFWFERAGAPAAASKAFFTTRLADLALLAGVLLLIGTLGNGRMDVVLAAPAQGKIAPVLLLAIALLLFTGAAAASGAAYQLLAHGLITGALFFLVGMLAERTGTREIPRLSGLWAVLPLYGSILVFAMFASLGLPALADFVAEVQIVLGTLGVYRWAAVGMLIGILATTAMFLWTLQRVLLGKTPAAWENLPRLSGREIAILVPLIALIVLLGVFPGPLAHIINAALHSGPLGIFLWRGW
jgi:NADH:ubiquinone oxidoreductase subunit 5 (subunit L)/multisubunit Na+/H+ antiporter MnhA subunit